MTWNECSSGPFPFRLGIRAKLCCPSVPYVLTGLPRSKIVPGTDKALPENSQPNLNKKLDGAVEETFPSSDPVSVSITKGGAIEWRQDNHNGDRPVKEERSLPPALALALPYD